MPPMTPLFRTIIQRRTMSIGARARAAVRGFEPHPFERYPLQQKSAKADWGRQFSRLGRASVFYFPFLGLFFGWPLVAARLMGTSM
ncbi:hypothetical protein LSUE1_G007594 [Lachnellula suecica]|uniref:Uncharacterized protein n=1 Tax=Lachnellula suecica TaxID=602035 RepID=A0A8T9BZP5_9HELO|nr:hypothetical protein LSUE1_G007594 [Lachnellula suecica]